MGQSTKRYLFGSGFSLIELLVVISIITLLIGFLSTGIQAVKRHATNLRQKSSFHAIEVGLELFQKDYDDYPPSMTISDGTVGHRVCGAQHLAEALVGRDMKGFDPESNWYAPAEDDSIYACDVKQSTDEDIAACRSRRKELYIELKDMGVFVMDDLYENYTGDVYSTKEADSPDHFRAPVITDIFRQKKVKVPYREDSEWAGTPILYYKANSGSRLFKKVPEPSDEIEGWIYNYEDNRGIIELGTVKDPLVKHLFDESVTYTEQGQTRNGMNLFYKTITNPKVSYDKPFNASTFILISAGRDGIYGTADDISNFDY
ncbi:MAG TPA: type II secretion system protein [Planctomycetes bacterium]|nr:type II secretion system protein [Planctomycetota bacterium]HIJ70992.1 type II secretion system protein [Planctomycetota bacterium]